MFKWTFIALFMLSAIPVFAENLSLTKPENNAVVSQLWENQKDFLQKNEEERRALVADEKYREKIIHEPGKGTLPKPVDFEWKWDGKKAAEFTVKIAENADFSDAVTISADQNKINVANFKINQKYYWKVITVAADGKEAASNVYSFITEDQAPRLLDVPNVTNFRDIGGRKGLGGKRVRQNMIFRSTAFNENSKDGTVRGCDRVTAAGRDVSLNILKLKTELDLRSQNEVADMTVSPLGDQVKWINISTFPYDGAHTKDGKDIFIKEFRLFCDAKNYPVNFHCIAGADRTGTLAFILNAALGVSDAELIRDWEITIFNNRGNYFTHKSTFDHLINGLDKLGSPQVPYSAKVERYLLDGGITQKELETFRSIMLEN
jgi:protein-tyrosine phosphatase